MLYQLNARQREILFVLMEEKAFITISGIAHQLYLSPRAVRYNLPKIRLWLEEQSASLISKRGLGIYLDASKAQRSKLRSTLVSQKESAIYINPSRRLCLILLELLLSPNKMFISDFSQKLGISRTTVHNSIVQLSKIAKDYHLILLRDSKQGLILKGSERSIRYAICETLLKEISFSSWKNAWLNENNNLQNSFLFSDTREFVEKLNFSFGKRLVLRLEQGLGLEFTLSSRFFLALFIACSIQRLKAGHICEDLPLNIQQDDQSPEISTFISNCLLQVVDKNIPQVEIETLQATLYCLEPQHALGELQLPHYELFYPLAGQVIAEVAFYLHPSLKIDVQLERDLANYFAQFFYQLGLGFPTKQPDLKNIQNLYPDVFKIAIQALAIIKREIHFNVPYREVGQLTLIFAAALTRLRGSQDTSLNCLVICEEALAVRIHLMACLQKEFPNLKLLEADNNPQIFAKQVENAQLILSTTIIDSSNKPVIQINPIPTQSDWEAIRKWQLNNMRDSDQIKLISYGKQSILDIVEKDFITLRASVDAWEDTIALVGEALVNAGNISHNYLNAVKEILTIYGPFCHIAPGIILLHAKPGDGVFKLSLGILLLKQGVNFGNKIFDPVDIIFMLAAPDDFSHIFALGQLIALSKNADFLSEIRSAKLPKEILSSIWKHTSSDIHHL